MYIPRSILGYSHDWPAAAAGARVCRQMVSRCDQANWSASVRCPQALVYTGATHQHTWIELFTHTVRCISEDVDLEHKIVMTFTFS